MPVQGGASIDHGLAYAGMVADLQRCNAVSRLNKGLVGIPYGLGVVTDGDDGAKVPDETATAAEFNGVVKYELNRARQDGEEGAPAGYDMTVVTHGVIYVNNVPAVAKDDPVFLIIGDGTPDNDNVGKFSNVAGATVTAAIQITDAKWVSSESAEGLAKISLGLGG